MVKTVKRPNRLLWFAVRIVAKRFAKKVNLKVFDDVTGKLKPPYIVLCNHASVQDYKISSFVLRKVRPNHVAAYNQFSGKAKLLKILGAVPKRQLTSDISLVRQIKSVLDRNGVFVIYPEAAVSIDGGNRRIHLSVAKLVKLFKVPVVSINIKGSYISKPRWNELQQKTDRVEAHANILFTKEDIVQKTQEEIYKEICSALSHNVWQWQREQHVKNLSQSFLEGAESLLYQCPSCLKEFKMTTEGNTIKCGQCGKSWRINPYGEFESDGICECRDVSEWVAFQSAGIREQLKKGEYSFSVKVNLETIEDFSGYKQRGEGTLHQNKEGTFYKDEQGGQMEELFFPAEKTSGCLLSKNHAELPASDNGYKFVMKETNAATKICLAVYECYDMAQAKNKIL